MKLKTLAAILCVALMPICAVAEELTAEQMDYVKGALRVPRDIVVTSCECYDFDESDDSRQGMLCVQLYSNDEILAGATLDPETLQPQYDVWEFSETHVRIPYVEHQRASEWSEADMYYLKGAFRIPWNVKAHCDVGEPYFWDGGGIWLTSVGFYAGEVCHGDTMQEEWLAGASIESDQNVVSMVRDIYGYSPDNGY